MKGDEDEDEEEEEYEESGVLLVDAVELDDEGRLGLAQDVDLEELTFQLLLRDLSREVWKKE